MLHSFSNVPARITAIWSTCPDEDQVIFIDWDTREDDNLPQFNQDSITKWQEMLKEEDDSNGEFTAVASLHSGKMFVIRPIYDTIEASRIMREVTGDGIE